MKQLIGLMVVLAALLGILAPPATAATQDATITITPSAVNATSVTGWLIERKVGSGAYAQLGAILPVGTTTLTDPGLLGGTTYCYRGTAVSALGNSVAGVESCVATGGVPGAPTVNVVITIH